MYFAEILETSAFTIQYHFFYLFCVVGPLATDGLTMEVIFRMEAIGLSLCARYDIIEFKICRPGVCSVCSILLL